MVELYAHNRETYNKAVDILNKYNKVLIVQAPSTGKSFITMRLIQEDFRGKKILFVVPTYSIRLNIESYEEWDGENVTFYSYSFIHSRGCSECLKDFDVVIFDEVHHAGAELWGQSLQWVLENNKTCVGLTATPVRSSDGVDVSEKYFKDCTIFGLDLKSAIETKTLVDFKYYLVLADITKKLEEAKDKIFKTPMSESVINLRSEYEGLNLSDISNYEMSNLVQSNLSSKVNKWLVFCSKKSELKDIDQDIHEWFGDYSLPILKVDSSYTRKQIKKSLEYFNTYNGDKPIVLVSINILNEGLHVNGVTGVIFLRRTKSLSIFIQQCGRGLTTNKNITPVFIDAVENINALRARKSRRVNDSEKQTKKQDPALSTITDILSIKDTQLLDVVDFIESVESYDKNKELTYEEIGVLRRFWPDVYTRINKPKSVILKAAKELGLIKENKYTPEIDQKIKELYPKEGSNMAYAVGLTKDEVRYRANKLGVKYRNRWTLEDDRTVLLGGIPEGRTKEECNERIEVLRRKLI